MSDSYYRNVNADLLAWLPLSATRVLEIGCGEGALAAAYRQRNPGAHYTAVELHAPSAAVARSRVDRLIGGDIETMPDPDVGGPFDLALMGDVLEHLAESDRMLARIFTLLEPGGRFVACVPNFAHWSALRELMLGCWPDADSGLFDRTHLRFFTQDSLIAALKRAGFRLLRMRPRRFLLDKAEAERWIPALADTAAGLGIDRKAFIARAETLQYVVCAEKPVPDKPARPSLVLHNVAMAPLLMSARTKLPALALVSEPDLSVTYEEKGLTLPPAGADQPKVAVIQRASPGDAAAWLGAVGRLSAAGWTVVVELDDHPALIARVHGRADDPLSTLVLSAAHAVQTSTPLLAAYFRTLNPEVAVFPNAAFHLAPFPEERAGPVRVFYGALNREGFSGGVARALAPAIARHPEVEFVVVHDKAFFEGLPTTRKAYHPAMAYDAYLDLMGTCDIALMPLEGAEPERFKSDIKFVEASSRGLATIASPAVYGESIRHDRDGLIVEDVAGWSDALARLVADTAARRGLARTAWDRVRTSRMFAHQVGARRDWYRSLWERRADLTEGMAQRHPELRAIIAAASPAQSGD